MTQSFLKEGSFNTHVIFICILDVNPIASPALNKCLLPLSVSVTSTPLSTSKIVSSSSAGGPADPDEVELASHLGPLLGLGDVVLGPLGRDCR